MNEMETIEKKQEPIKLICPVCKDPEHPVDHMLKRQEKVAFDDSRTNEQDDDWEWTFTGFVMPCCHNFFADNISDEDLEKIHNGTMTQSEFDALNKSKAIQE
jgi:hypothetical protein